MKIDSSALKVAVIGAGRWGPNLIRNFHCHPESTVTFVADLSRERLAVIRRQYRGIDISTDWRVAVESPAVDAVVIATPSNTHAEIARAALLAGKHVLVEKPLATSHTEARELVALAKLRDLRLMVGHIFLFNPAVRVVKEIVDSGKLGDILYATSTRTNSGPIRTDVSALWDLAPHDLSMLLHLFGWPSEGFATGTAFLRPGIEDVAFASLRFPGGKLAHLHVSWLEAEKIRRWVIVGTRRTLVFNDVLEQNPISLIERKVSPDDPQSIVDNLRDFRKSVGANRAEYPKIPVGEPLKNECHAFLAWVRRGEPQPSDGELGARVVLLLERLQASLARRGDRVSFGETKRPAWLASFSESQRLLFAFRSLAVNKYC